MEEKGVGLMLLIKSLKVELNDIAKKWLPVKSRNFILNTVALQGWMEIGRECPVKTCVIDLERLKANILRLVHLGGAKV